MVGVLRPQPQKPAKPQGGMTTRPLSFQRVSMSDEVHDDQFVTHNSVTHTGAPGEVASRTRGGHQDPFIHKNLSAFQLKHKDERLAPSVHFQSQTRVTMPKMKPGGPGTRRTVLYGQEMEETRVPLGGGSANTVAPRPDGDHYRTIANLRDETTENCERRALTRWPVHDRNHSTATLGRNIAPPQADLDDYVSTAQRSFADTGPPTRFNRFNLPQKNMSYFHRPSLAHGSATREAPLGFSSTADHYQLNAADYHRTDVPLEHYDTTAASHFAKPNGKLTVPGGKGAWDYNASNVDYNQLEVANLPKTWDCTTGMVHNGEQQPVDQRRAAMPVRGTLGIPLR